MNTIARVGGSFSALFLFVALATGNLAWAEQKDLAVKSETISCEALLRGQAIPVKWVEKMIVDGKATNPVTQRLRDVVQRVGFTQASVNQAVLRAHNEKYTHEIDQGPITNQKQSGRCWIFAGLNMVRSGLIADGKVPANFEFSENYLHFFNMLEKSNRYLERVIEQTSPNVRRVKKQERLSRAELRASLNPGLGDGGWYAYFMFLVSKYGMVPKSAMPETKSSESTAALISELERHLSFSAIQMLGAASELSSKSKTVSAKDHAKAMRAVKDQAMADIWRVLATHLGDPPAEFEYRTAEKQERQGRTHVTPATIVKYSPQAFARDFIKFDAADYVVVSASPVLRPGTYEEPDSAIGPTERGKPKYNVRYLNVSIDRLEELAIAAIEGGQTVWFAADVGRDVDHATGVMHPEVYERDALYAQQGVRFDREVNSVFGLATPNHAMLLTGFDRPDPNGPVVKFKNENSWGDQVGTRGTYHLYREWFHENVFQVVVHKKFLSTPELESWMGKSKRLSPGASAF